VRKRRNMVGYDEWLRLVLGGESDDEHHGHFWRMHDVAAQLDRWAAAGSAERVIAVVSDEGDRGFLPRLFEGLLGLPEGILVPSESRTNRSLDLTGAELLRALDGVAHEYGWEREVYLDDLKPAISKYLRSRPHDGNHPIALPEWARERVAELNATRVRTLESTGVRVIGDPASLSTAAGGGSPVFIESASVPIALATGLAGVGIERMLQREVRLERRVATLRKAAEASGPHEQGAGKRPVRRQPPDKRLGRARGRELVRAFGNRWLRRSQQTQ
jgi:hypothetical protein